MMLEMVGRRGLGVLVILMTWNLAPVWTRDADDVTTIYRFSDTDFTDDFDKAAKLDDWTLSPGFLRTYNTLVDVPFPDEGFVSMSSSQGILSDVLPINTSTTFAISSDVETFNIYLMSEHDISLGNLIVFRLVDNNRVDVLTCDYGKEGDIIDLPGVGLKRCLEIRHNGNCRYKTLGSNITVYFEEDKVHASNNGFIFDFPSQFFQNMKYLSMVPVANTGNFSFRRPVRVLALSGSSGYISHPDYYYHPHLSNTYRMMCFNLVYYIDQNSGGEIYLYHEEENKTLIGKVFTSQHKESWQKQRFIISSKKYVSFKSLEIHAKKTSKGPLLIHSLGNCEETDSWVSTSFSVSGNVEIHARTNALGRPFRLRNGTIVDPNVEIDVPSCPNRDGECTWNLNNWSSLGTCIPEMNTAPLPLWREGTKYMVADGKVLSDVFPFSGNIDLTFSFVTTPDDDRQLQFYISSGTRVRDELLLLVQITDNGLEVLEENEFWGKWRVWFPNGPDIPSSKICSRRSSYEFTFTDGMEYRLRVVKDGNILSVIVGNKEAVLECHGPFSFYRDFEKYYLSIASKSLIAEVFVPSEVNYMLSLDQQDGNITSPIIVPTNEELCVSLLYYKTGGILTLDAVLKNESRVQLAELNNTNGWNFIRILKKLGRKPLRLVLQGSSSEVGESEEFEGTTSEPVESNEKNKSVKILVQRIAGCHPEEDIANLGREQNLQVFNPVSGEKGGRSPKTRCGSNRFGDDCNGRCSDSSQGCMGMVLCKPNWGCSCAPGFKGIFCSKHCENGKYGADCRQTCENCAELESSYSRCETATGICRAGCTEGYHPPMCQERCSYFVAAPLMWRSNNNIIVALPKLFLGGGTPLYYQVQYKEVDSQWKTIYSAPIVTLFLTRFINIAEPSSRDIYYIRGIVINEDGCTYMGEAVPFAEMKTECKIPDPELYNLTPEDIQEDRFRLVWQPVTNDEGWCEIAYYEIFIKEGWNWLLYGNSTSTSHDIKDRSPGHSYQVKLRAVTTHGNIVGFSETVEVKTNMACFRQISQSFKAWEPNPVSFKPSTHLAVQNFRVVASNSTQLHLVWEYPYSVNHFRITYQCISLLGCPSETCFSSQGELTTNQTSAILRDLSPLAQYKIQISAFCDWSYPISLIQTLTLPAGPQVTPSEVLEPIKDPSNTSFTVQWAPPSSCSKLNGFQQGYWYRLMPAGERIPLLEGSTLRTSAYFANLTPCTKYEVDVFVVNEEGWNEDYPLTIPASTRATTPEPVTNLTVYKRGRREIGLRWAPPAQTYGELESFTITYMKTTAQNRPSSEVTTPTPCSAWPHLYCFTLSNLRPNVEYSILVKARNAEVPEDGEATSVIGKTHEDAPTAPAYIELVDTDSTSLTIKWGIPWMLNGILRSFLIILEEVDSYNSSDCCEYFPTREMPVNAEQRFYQIEVAGLRPASTYTINVSAKTMGIGPAMNLTAHTKPPVPTIPSKPEVLIDAETNELVAQLTPVTEFQDLIRGYLLLLVPESADVIPEPSIWDETLAQDIKTAVNQSFYIVGEYSQEQLNEGGLITFLDNEDSGNQTHSIGVLSESSHFITNHSDSYKLILVAVSEYQGAYSFSLKESESFVNPP